MEIFSMNSRFIIDSLIKFNNNEIDISKLNSQVFLGTAFNYFFFKKSFIKSNELKESQNKIFQAYFKKESAMETTEKKLIAQVRQKKLTVPKAQEMIREQRSDLLKNLLQHKEISTYVEHSYNSYIPPKNFSLSLDFHLADYKEFKKYLSVSNTNINYKNPILSNKKKRTFGRMSSFFVMWKLFLHGHGLEGSHQIVVELLAAGNVGALVGAVGALQCGTEGNHLHVRIFAA